MSKLNFKTYVKKYFEPLTRDCWTCRYDSVVLGFAPSDLGHYYIEDLPEEYKKYLDGTADDNMGYEE
jgi:hypothetical protein